MNIAAATDTRSLFEDVTKWMGFDREQLRVLLQEKLQRPVRPDQINWYLDRRSDVPGEWWEAIRAYHFFMQMNVVNFLEEWAEHSKHNDDLKRHVTLSADFEGAPTKPFLMQCALMLPERVKVYTPA
tara:strand:+ start:2408 stop:2788 length:381 start_codon:yes stop_codon:yes gene_type:complete